MPTAKEHFLAHVNGRASDRRVWDLRRELIRVKADALAQAAGLEEAQLRQIMPGLYGKIVVGTIQIGALVGVGVGLALEAFDEAEAGASISNFSREVRSLMTETGAALQRRHASPIAKLTAEIEAQRLSWRHSHEFLSWLGFRRDDPRYPASSRRERLDAFKVREKLLRCRDIVTELVGHPLCVALEGHDRFLLANRWHLSPTPEHGVERYTWQLLSYQPSHVVMLESTRLEYDAQVDAGAAPEALAAARAGMLEEFKYQLAEAMDHLPEAARGGLLSDL